MNRTVIISPSGNFYGSEQVLWEYLYQTKGRFTLWVPADSRLVRKLSEEGTTHHVKTFNPARLPFLYLRVALQLFKGVTHVYVNEGGHNRWMRLLAGWFPRKHFIVHVRMLEDAQKARWPGGSQKNLQVISISKTVADQLPFSSHLIYDPYRFSDRHPGRVKGSEDRLVIGVIGRITITKGLERLLELVRYIRDQGEGRFIFHLYGSISREEDNRLVEELLKSPDVRVMGFRDRKEDIYANIDCVLHLSVEEALGRIFFEAIDYGIPFAGFEAAGIKEIGQLTGLSEWLVSPGDGWKERMYGVIEVFDKEYGRLVDIVSGARRRAAACFSTEKYVMEVDKLISA
jgi:glycosyltransferase involved in cell wall biosynthesis